MPSLKAKLTATGLLQVSNYGAEIYLTSEEAAELVERIKYFRSKMVKRETQLQLERAAAGVEAS